MPLPSPHKDETKDSFMDRCTSNPETKGAAEDAENKQDAKVAICLKQWRKK